MALRERSELVGFDADEACQYLLEAVGEDLLVVAEYTPEDYRLLYVGEDLEAKYGSTEAVTAAADSIHEYIDLDFRERELFLDLYPTLEDVDGLITVADRRSVVRVVTPADEGLYFSVPLDVPAVELVRDVVGIVDRAV
ncbi:hypothetical protein GCM10028857_16150 [Salinarchaeum chitinilyticum]